MEKPKVLLTAGYGPNELGWGEDMYDLLTARLARGHGIFNMSSHCHYFALYLIAENLTCPTTVLENPHWEDFDRELDQGYDVVGFQLKSLHTAKIARMMKRVREKLPSAKIVVGGYGVGTLGQPVPGDVNGDAVYIRENADHLCREEGVGFMRKLVGDDVGHEITQYHMPTPAFALAGLRFHLRLPIILVSLGCPNACDFCNTSAFFQHKKIRVADAEQTYRFIRNYQKRFKTENIFVLLFDEDIFLDPDYVRELGRLLRSDKKTWGVRWFSFGSIRSMSKFTAEELRDCGLGAVWIGVESFMCGQESMDTGYAKRNGAAIEKAFADLHRNGIATIGSLVLGFDFHDNENLKEDIDRFVGLKPTFYQLSPLTPCPGTALYERMLEEGRILDTYQWEDFNLWKDDVFALKNFVPGEIKRHFDYAHQKLHDELGPPIVQGFEMMLDAAQLQKGSTDPYHKRRARQNRMAARAMHIYCGAIKNTHPSEKVRRRVEELDRRFHEEIGFPIPFSHAMDKFVSWKVARDADRKGPVVSDPPPRWSYYNTFDDRVWVKKGSGAKKAKPYSNRRILSRL